MRIISGKYRGHQLVAFKAEHIRPTTDRVKETLFNKWQFQVEGAKVLDLFCGTGNLGLEALSRHADNCTFVENNLRSLTVTRQNIEKLKVPASQYTIINRDVIKFLKDYKGEGFDLIFADPPFTERMAHFVMEAAASSEAFTLSTLLAIESLKQERMESQYGDLIRYEVKDYGDKLLNFFCHTSAIKEKENE